MFDNNSHQPRSRAPRWRLDVYRVALQLFAGVERIAAALPKGHADTKDQMRRSAAAVARHIAEGAGRWSARDKAHRYVIALAECEECAGTIEMAGLVGVVPEDEAAKLVGYTDRIGAMLTRLVQSQRARAQE